MKPREFKKLDYSHQRKLKLLNVLWCESSSVRFIRNPAQFTAQNCLLSFFFIPTGLRLEHKNVKNIESTKSHSPQTRQCPHFPTTFNPKMVRVSYEKLSLIFQAILTFYFSISQFSLFPRETHFLCFRLWCNTKTTQELFRTLFSVTENISSNQQSNLW